MTDIPESTIRAAAHAYERPSRHRSTTDRAIRLATKMLEAALQEGGIVLKEQHEGTKIELHRLWAEKVDNLRREIDKTTYYKNMVEWLCLSAKTLLREFYFGTNKLFKQGLNGGQQEALRSLHQSTVEVDRLRETLSGE